MSWQHVIYREAEIGRLQAEERYATNDTHGGTDYGIAATPGERVKPHRCRFAWCADCDAPRRGLWPAACTVCGKALEVNHAVLRGTNQRAP